MITKEQEKWYLEHHGVRCPFCRKGNAVACGGFNADSDSGTQKVECDACGKTWLDLYELTVISED